MTDRPTVLFVCVHNAGRSQMAAALLSRATGGSVDVRSAGSQPAGQLNPAVLEVMSEVGIDLVHVQPRVLDLQVIREADVVVTMGCGDTCPVFPGKTYLDWDLADPAGLPIEQVRRIRDEIARRVGDLRTSLLPEPDA